MYYYEANGQKHELGKNNSEAFTVLKTYYEAVAHLSVSMERTKAAYEISYFQTGLVKALKKMVSAKDELDVMAQAFYDVNIKERFAPSVLELNGSDGKAPSNWQEAYLKLGKVLAKECE